MYIIFSSYTTRRGRHHYAHSIDEAAEALGGYFAHYHRAQVSGASIVSCPAEAPLKNDNSSPHLPSNISEPQSTDSAHLVNSQLLVLLLNYFVDTLLISSPLAPP